MERSPRRRFLVIPLWLGFFLYFFAVAMLLSLPLAIVTDGEWSAYVFGIVFGIAFALFRSRRWRRTILATDEDGYTLRIERRQ
jgi:membrane associated rhomboid family serine protease